MGCRICSHKDRTAIEATASTAGLVLTAHRFGLSERSLERHIRDEHANSRGVRASSSDASVEEDPPPTSRSPVFAPSSGVRITVSVDDRAVASTVLTELERVRGELAEALGDIDSLIATYRRIADEVAA